MRTHVAFLRGINVGGNKLVKMPELKAFCSDLGLEEPVTLLQSGNVAFRSDQGAQELESLLEREAPARFGFSIDFFVRSAAELAEVIVRNPFPAEAESDPSHLLVVFLKEPANRSQVETVQAA